MNVLYVLHQGLLNFFYYISAITLSVYSISEDKK